MATWQEEARRDPDVLAWWEQQKKLYDLPPGSDMVEYMESNSGGFDFDEALARGQTPFKAGDGFYYWNPSGPGPGGRSAATAAMERGLGAGASPYVPPSRGGLGGPPASQDVLQSSFGEDVRRGGISRAIPEHFDRAVGSAGELVGRAAGAVTEPFQEHIAEPTGRAASALFWGEMGRPEAQPEPTAENTPPGAMAGMMASDMIAQEPDLVASAVDSALGGPPPAVRTELENVFLSNLRKSAGTPFAADAEAMAQSLGLEPIDVQDILDTYAEAEPEKPAKMDKEEVILRVLFGLAAGSARGSRGYYPDIGRMLASAGAGGAGALIEARKEDRESQTEYERSFQKYKTNQAKIEAELRDAQFQQKAAVATLAQRERDSYFTKNIEAFKATQKTYTAVAGGYLEISPTGGAVFKRTDDTAAANSRLRELQARVLLQSFPSLGSGYSMDHQIKVLREEGTSEELIPLHVAAGQVMYAFADDAIKQQAKDNVLRKNPHFAELQFSSKEGSRALMDNYVYGEIMLLMQTEPGLALRILREAGVDITVTDGG